MSETMNNTITKQPETVTTHPEENGATTDANSLFTQEDVNKIVSDRLSRERAKGELTPVEQREQELTVRENKLTCRDYIEAEGFPAGLLDILDTSDAERFKQTLQQLDEILHLPSKTRRPAPFVKPIGKGTPMSTDDAAIAAAFKPQF